MPIFEYICRDCHHQFETFVTASRAPSCPTCESDALDKQLSVFAVAGGGRERAPAGGGRERAPAGGGRERAPAGGSCGSCGDPRGPGSCNLN